ncbi:hypothetical protein Ancab_024419 [Ancistrocladus abbreviatus]
MSVDGYQVPLPPNTLRVNFDGSGGLIVDSGTALTNLIEAAYYPVTALLDQQIQLSKVVPIPNLGLEHCYEMPSSMSVDQLPKLVIHFNGSDDLELSWENYIMEVLDGVGCLAIAPSPMHSILGNIAAAELLCATHTQHHDICASQMHWAMSLNQSRHIVGYLDTVKLLDTT